jgi:kynurenine formamidase
MGNLHLVDVRPLAGKAAFSEAKPTGPVITLQFLQEHAKSKPFQPGEIVAFRTGHTDAKLKPLPAAPDKDALFVLPLEGKAEGWASPTPEAIAWLAGQGIRCVATDGPALGGVDPNHSQQVDWMAAGKGMLVIEFLTNLQAVEGKEAFFLFAPIKIEGTRGGYGRALAIVK